MERDYYLMLAKVRLDRAAELIEEAEYLLEREAFKSANNRAFYSIEKSIKALLATEEVEVTTHNGGLKQFNYLFIHKGDGSFTAEDYKGIARAEQIRSISDYDDFYIANKQETKEQVSSAAMFYEKAKNYIDRINKDKDIQ